MAAAVAEGRQVGMGCCSHKELRACSAALRVCYYSVSYYALDSVCTSSSLALLAQFAVGAQRGRSSKWRNHLEVGTVEDTGMEHRRTLDTHSGDTDSSYQTG